MTIVIGTDQGLRSLDGGEERLAGQPITAISGDWALVGEHRLVSLTSRVETKLDGPRGWCVLDTGERLYVGTAEARLFVVPSAGAGDHDPAPLASFDRIETRDEWYTPWGAPPDTRSLTAGPDGALFVNVHVGGVWRQLPDDRWAEVVSVDADTHQVTAGEDAVVAAAAVGFGRSLDGGTTWDWTADGLHGTYCRAAAIAGDTVLVTASTGPFAERGALYRRPLRDDGPFAKCEDGLPEWFPFNLDTGQLAALGDEAVLGTDDGRVFRSTDAGVTWELVATQLPAVRAISLR